METCSELFHSVLKSERGGNWRKVSTIFDFCVIVCFLFAFVFFLFCFVLAVFHLYHVQVVKKYEEVISHLTKEQGINNRQFRILVRTSY